MGTEAPVPNQEVTLFQLITNMCVNKPSQWEPIRETVTDADGCFEFAILPAVEDWKCCAAGLGSDPNQVLASSDYIQIPPLTASGNAGETGGPAGYQLPFADLAPAPNV